MRMDAAFALHRLDDDRRRVRPDMLEPELGPRDERLERGALRRLAGDRERAEGAAVERAVERDELGAAGRPCAPT